MTNALGSMGRGEALNISAMPFEFNPPIHPSLMHVFPVAGLSTSRQVEESLKAIYDEQGHNYTAAQAKENFQNLRLGRIVMSDESLAFAVKTGVRYGFRFLYNPSTVAGGSGVGTDFIPDQNNAVMAVLQEGLETITFELMLNRVPEVMGGATRNDYHTSISKKEFDAIRERGTHYDIEYLYRCCNGAHNTKARANTGDIGIMLPNPVELFLGPFRSRGALNGITVQDRMFSQDMVPVLSMVTLSFSRFLSTSSEGIIRDGRGVRADVRTVPSIRLGSAGGDWVTTFMRGVSVGDLLGSGSSGGSSGVGGGSSEPAPVPGTAKMTGAQVYRLALDHWNASDARTMTQIAWGESGWNTKAHNPNRSTGDNSYGLWQINMIETYGAARRRQFGIASNDELFDARTNARAAHSIWKGQGFRAWTIYTSGKYRSAPSW
jgi:hypothetical protein